MISFLQSLLAFILALGLLITFHEFGHFCIARLCNVKVLRFSVGFGRPLWKRHFGPDRSEFVIGAVPLGGYVKMLDEREGGVSGEDLDRAFNRKSLGQRTAIVAAGPIFNFLFAVGAYWIMYMVGMTALKPVVGGLEPASVAEQAGFRAGDLIVSVDGEATPTWPAVIEDTVGNVVGERVVEFRVVDANGRERAISLDLSRISLDDLAGGRMLSTLGIRPKRPRIPAVLGEVIEDGAAEAAGLKSGDRVVAADGVTVRDWEHWVELVRASPAQRISVEIQRGNDYLVLDVTPEPVDSGNGERIGRIGAGVDTSTAVDQSLVGHERYSPGTALLKGVEKTGEVAVLTLRVLGKMIMGEASVRNLSGPISIAQYAGQSAGVGIAAFMGFLAIVSVSLGVLNLLPIPLLDGGHLMYYLIELLKGSPVSESMQAVGQQLGLVLLLGLMSLAFYNDILRLIG